MRRRVGKPDQQVMAREAARKRAEKRAVLTLLENKSLLALFKAIEAKWNRALRLADTTAKREDLWFKLHGLDALYVEMKARIDRGTAQDKLDQAVRARSEQGPAPERKSPALDKVKE